MEVHEMEKDKEPSMHLTHEHMLKLGFPQEHKPQAGDKYSVSGVVHVESVMEHDDAKDGKTQHVHMKFSHMGVGRVNENKPASHKLYPTHATQSDAYTHERKA